ncbi:hypothetical protein SGLAM104S_03242 [Streptomyces glaucescens]
MIDSTSHGSSSPETQAPGFSVNGVYDGGSSTPSCCTRKNMAM